MLVDFWTYTCINWLRTFPYVRAWAEKYRDQGLVVIGVHAPEFAFEKDLDNVRRAAKAMGVEHPVAVDNDKAIWRAFDNRYWPALYFVDAQGRIRHHQFGEGEYEGVGDESSSSCSPRPVPSAIDRRWSPSTGAASRRRLIGAA